MKTKKEIEEYLVDTEDYLKEFDADGELSQEDYNEITKEIETLKWVLRN